MNLKIFFCGDVHGHFDHLIEAVREHAAAALILLGDIQAQKPLERELEWILDETEIWFIHGNHDTDSEADYDNLFGSKLADRNLDGRVVEVAGVRIAGLGGIFRGQIWRPPENPDYRSADDFERRQGAGNKWRDGLTLKHHSSIFPDVYDRLAALRADVLVTHEAPAVHPHGLTRSMSWPGRCRSAPRSMDTITTVWTTANTGTSWAIRPTGWGLRDHCPR